MENLRRHLILVFCLLLSGNIYEIEAALSYKFHLDSAGQAIEGYLDTQAKLGSKVPVKPVEGTTFIENGMAVNYLQVILRSGVKTNSDEYIARNTDAFAVDDEGYILVNKTGTFVHNKVVEFYVVLIRDEDVVSDPVPFIVLFTTHTTSKAKEYNKTATVFAGVLVGLIVIFALFIPFVVRAKRRAKLGKPIFKLGSHPSNLIKSQEKTSSNGQINHPGDKHGNIGLTNRSMTEGDFYDNYAYRLEMELEKEMHELSNDLIAIDSHLNHVSDDDTPYNQNDYTLFKEKGKSGLKNGCKPVVFAIELKEENETNIGKSGIIEESAYL